MTQHRARCFEKDWKYVRSADTDIRKTFARERKRLAEEAARQWTAGFNPRRVTKADFARLYEAAFG